MKYSDQIASWLSELGYTHCFYVGGGNIMHLLESLSKKLDCRATIHEVAAGIATAYFNETSSSGKALALVTAGPGVTNIVTALAGAFLESQELLVLGGQVKTSDLSKGELRQRGIQEIDGVSITKPISVRSVLLDAPLPFTEFTALTRLSSYPRKGPVFIEMPLDVQAREFISEPFEEVKDDKFELDVVDDTEFDILVGMVRQAQRPLLLLGGGVSREAAQLASDHFASMRLPIATTWNGADRIDASHPSYVGRPNTWGQRSANLILQQSDLLIALGTRLGMQQTGFNWQAFVPGGKVVQVDIDPAELAKGHPHVEFPLCADADDLLLRLAKTDLGDHLSWLEFARGVRETVPLIESVNKTREQYISPYFFVDELSALCESEDVIVPCSSGGAFTIMMQIFQQKAGQMIVTNKGLASMGYGLSGAIGAAVANPSRRVILVEGDGGFAQNLQEIGTAAINQLNLKMFIFDDAGYASIRMTQRSYFGGRYMGCDPDTGLGLPNWEKLFGAWDVPVLRIGPGFEESTTFQRRFSESGVSAFVVSIDPEQTYFPKIASRITESGTMESNPLHLMTPDLDAKLWSKVSKYIST